MSVELSKIVETRSSVRLRLLGLLGLMLVTFLLIIVAGVFFFVRQTEQDAWQGRQAETTRAGTDKIARFMQYSRTGTSYIGEIDESYIKLMMQMDPALMGTLLENTQEAMLEVVRTDSAGNIIGQAAVDEPLLANSFTIPQSQWFIEASNGADYMSKVYISSQNTPYLIISNPIEGGGAVAARLNMQALWEVSSEIRFGKTGQAYIVDREGQMIAHNDPSYVLGQNSIPTGEALFSVMDQPGQLWRGSYTNFLGEEVLGTSMQIPDTDWLLVTEITRSEAYQTSNRALQLLGGGLLLLTVVIVTTSYGLLQLLILNPLQQLRKGAEAIASGDLQHQVKITSRDEFGLVSQSFNQMATRLSQREAQLIAQAGELAQANRQLADASRLKDEFLSTMSHELRTPLNAILGYTGLILMGITGKVDEDASETVRSIEESGRHLLNLINDVLDIAKIEAGRMEIVSQPIAVSAMMDRWKQHVSVLASEKGLTFETFLDPNMPRIVYGDEERLTQIAINLLGNAVKFTDHGTVRLEIRQNSGEHWEFQVSDTGVGIPPQAQEYIFDEFRQVDGSYSRSHGGTGLGLAIVRKLCNAMHGQVQLTSQLGKGSTFAVTLPLKVAEISSAEVPVATV